VTSTFIAAAAQISPRLSDLDANLALYAEQLRAARGLGVDLLVFPELSLTGYFLKDMVSTVALRLDSKEIKQLRALSRRGNQRLQVLQQCRVFRRWRDPPRPSQSLSADVRVVR
jgi:predicted amidohydrolase